MIGFRSFDGCSILLTLGAAEQNQYRLVFSSHSVGLLDLASGYSQPLHVQRHESAKSRGWSVPELDTMLDFMVDLSRGECPDS